MTHEHVFPWWAGYLLLNPMRKRATNPEKLLEPYVKPGMTVLDLGCAMGFFSLPLAEKVGDKGRVVCVDLQKKMIQTLKRRATRAGLAGRIDERTCSKTSLMIADLAGQVNFALAFAVIHEVPDRKNFLAEVYRSLRTGGVLLVGEPARIVSPGELGETIDDGIETGFTVKYPVQHGPFRTVALVKE